MGKINYFYNEDLLSYLRAVTVKESEACQRIRAQTATLKQGKMSITPEQGQFLGFLVRALGVQQALEVGTFTGYSAAAIAEALPESGQLTCLEISDEFAEIARKHWADAGLDERVHCQVGPALDSLQAMLNNHQDGQFDFAFVDADKENYPHYFEKVLQLLKPGGVLIVDNVLWSGRVWEEDNHQASTETIRRFNADVCADSRVDATLIPLGDGLLLIRKH